MQMKTPYLLAALLLVCAGCDQKNDAVPAQANAPAVATNEVDELQRAIEADAAKPTNAAKPSETQQPTAEQEKPAPKKPAAEPKEKPQPAVVGFDADEDRFKLEFTVEPDLTRLMDYVKVTPNPGPLTQDWWSWSKACWMRGTFTPRTEYKVVVKAGLPMADGRVTTNEFRRTWRTGDRRKDISFVAGGRYLPACGLRAVGVKTMNVTNLLCQIRMVPVRNIVQLLAREEDRYSSYYGGDADSSKTEELAGEPVSRPLRVKTRLNEACTTPLALRDDDGEAANGIYLASARDADGKGGRTAWKLVCVTDIGLSVREANGTVYVWATSLTKGSPVKDLRVLVYGANNVVMGEGLTDAEGWCSCEMPEAGKPFAVVASRMDGTDTSFLALADAVDENTQLGARRPFLTGTGSEAYVWTDRGIYRHGETILVHAILRDAKGQAPKPFPVTLSLVDPEFKTLLKRTQVIDRYGVVARTDFSVPDDQPSGTWRVCVETPGDDPVLLGEREIKIEEFVPPQIRVKVEPPATSVAGSNMLFTVSAEHLFGGPAKGLPAEGAVMFEDTPFAPKGWDGFRFGDESRSLQPNFTTLDRVNLDDQGRRAFSIDFPARARPRAAVRMTVQGSVFESGGRPASARTTSVVHAYPYYIGVALPGTVRESPEPRACRVVMVNPDGTPHAGARRLLARFERIDCVYGLKKVEGCWEWRSDRIRYPMGEEVEVPVAATGLATLRLPASVCGDCAVTLFEPETGVSFSAGYWVGGKDDGTVRASLENPSKVTIVPDKATYRPGERPRLAVKAPFAGCAWVSVLQNEMVYSQVITLTNATSEVVLEPATTAWAPGVDVMISVVQAAKPGARHVVNRAYGVAPIRVTPSDRTLDVKVKANVVCAPTGGSSVTVEVDARGEAAVGAIAAVTVVDEGINLLTDEKTPDPAAWFAETRQGEHDLFDIFNRLLPIFDESYKRAGAKTGGGADCDLFRRVSPVPTRRFKPLSTWKLEVPLRDGRATVPFSLPEFVGEVRVTAVAYNRCATGAGSVQAKVSPKLVSQPDAPRFAAPGDVFLATLTLSNRSGGTGTATYDLMAGGAIGLDRPIHGTLSLADGASETLTFPVKAGRAPGSGTLVFVAEGFGEKHKSEIELPVRPAVPWTKTARTVCLQPGETVTFTNAGGALPDCARRAFLASGNPVAELASALEYLVGYPHGCLEQTASRVFPLITAGGILNALPVQETSVAQDARATVDTGIRRVCSMVRANDFAAWPDTDTAPWNREVSLWAAHFLVEAQAAGFQVPNDRLARVKGFLRTWSMSTNLTTAVYACHTLALAGTPDRDRMLFAFDRRATLPLLSRARLARAFARTGDRDRARELVAAAEPTCVKDAAFALLALLELDPSDARIPGLVTFLTSRRGPVHAHWGTTEENAHALLALGAYYRMEAPNAQPPELELRHGDRIETLALKRAWRIVGGGDVTIANRGKGAAFVTSTRLALPDADVAAESSGIRVARRFLRVDGSVADLATLVRGEMIIVETTLTAPAQTTYSDLVLEELLPACFESDQTPVSRSAYPWVSPGVAWELRRDLRDDRVLAFSRRFNLAEGACARFLYAVRVVSAGEFVLPGPSVEAMYSPSVRARGESARLKIAK